MNSSNSTPRGVIFTDFDGTLFNHKRYISKNNYEALSKARRNGYITVIATGRSLYSFRKVAESLDRPIEDYFDYLIFSSGAGLIKSFSGIRGFKTDISPNDILEFENLTPSDAFEAASLLFQRGIDFMLQLAVPDNHHFVHVKSNGCVNPDYYRRIKIYEDFASSLPSGDEDSDLEKIEKVCNQGISQIVAIVPPSGNSGNEKYADELIEYLRHRLSQCSIIRTTSPIDQNSLWVEIFSLQISKSKTAARLAESLGFNAEKCLAIGNDFNDEDLLQWAGTARTVDEAPAQLKETYKSAGRAINGAVAEAIISFITNR